MNLLHEYIRETLLTESVHPKIMEMIDALERAKGYVEILPDRVIVWEPTEISPNKWVAMVAYETTVGVRLLMMLRSS